MKCAKCGAELKLGCIYCSVCGQEAQIVSDYNVLEDEYLRSLLEEGKPKQEQSENPEKKPTKKKKKKKVWPWVVLVIAIIVTIIAVVFVVQYKKYLNENSYSYQVEMAESELTDRNYENALSYYKNALNLEPNDVKVRLAMAEIYMEQKDYESAMVLLMDVINLDADNTDAYELLIRIYEKQEDYESIVELMDTITDEKLLSVFADYIVDEPEFLELAGEHDGYINIEIQAIDDIYYTIDGSDPIEDGILYENMLTFEEAGTYELKAVCCNKKGIYSDVAEMTVTVEFEAPDMPVVTPDGGIFDTETMISITVPEGCSAYYTLDNTTPTTASTKYEGEFAVPTGKSVLRVILVDDTTGLQSDEYSRQFTYMP